MKELRFFLFIICGMFCFGSLIYSCDDDIKYTTDPACKLSFSHDTVSFDTVFTTIGSSTRILKVYNSNKEALNITSVSLGNPGKSGFRVNVDGHHGTYFSDLELRKGDSLHVFVEVTVDPQNRNNPILVRDSLIFRMSNGIEQCVRLEAYGQDVVIMKGKIIDQDTVLTSWRPILIYDSLQVNANRVLILQQGTRLYFHDKAELKVYGTLKAEGNLAAPVLLRGDRMDNMFDNLPYERIPGQWGGVHLKETSYKNELNYIDIHGGMYGIRCDSSALDQMKLLLQNSVIHNVKGNGLKLDYCLSFIGNSQVTNAGNNCVYIKGGKSEFVHCTIANYYTWDVRKGMALYFTNVENKVGYPLQTSFYNCLITGSGQDDMQGVQATDMNDISFDYLFTNCVLNSKDEGLDNFIQVLWEQRKNDDGYTVKRTDNFLYIGKEDYEYDFRLDSASVAVNWGDIQYAQQYPYDRYGRSRLSDEAPDAGCYEWIPGEQKR